MGKDGQEREETRKKKKKGRREKYRRTEITLFLTFRILVNWQYKEKEEIQEQDEK